MQLLDLLDEYSRKHRRADKTLSVHRYAIGQLGQCLGREPTLEDLTDENLLLFERWLDNGRRRPYTVAERVKRVRTLWRFACRRGYLTCWPEIDAPPVPEVRPRAYTVQQIDALLRAARRVPGDVAGIPAQSWWHGYVLIAWMTGERSGALLRLMWEHVDLDRALIQVPGDIRKTGKAAVYDLPADGIAALAEIRSEHPRVFHWPKSISAFHYQFRRILKLAGLPITRGQTQMIRRSHLTYWQAGGGDASRRAQHSSPAVTTKFYLDETLLPRERVEDRLPSVSQADPVDLRRHCEECGSELDTATAIRRFCSHRCGTRSRRRRARAIG